MDSVSAGPVAALVLNWRRGADTVRVARELLASGYPDLHVHCADNGSGDGSVALLQGLVAEAGGDRVSVLENGENLGFGGGMNRMLRAAAARGAEYVLFCNNDLSVPPGFLEPMVEVLAACPDVVAVGPVGVLPDGRVWAEGGELVWGPNGARLRRHGGVPSGVGDGPVEVGFVPGACLLCRVADLVAVGGFAEDYFMYWEDVDLCVRLRERARGGSGGGDAWCCPGSGWCTMRGVPEAG